MYICMKIEHKHHTDTNAHTHVRRIIILYAASAKQPTRAKIIGLPTLYRLYRHALASTKYDKLHQN